MAVNVEKLKSMAPPKGMDFHISKLRPHRLASERPGKIHRFYTQVLGFKVSDVHPEEMMPGGMVFLRCNTDHHCLALVGAGDGKTRTGNCTISLSRSRPWQKSSAPAIALRAADAKIDFRGTSTRRLPDRRGVSRSR